MAIFYILHNIIPHAESSKITDGQRNARLFLIGIFIYVVLYIVLKNLELNGTISEFMYPTYKIGLIVMFVADISVMAWIYKNYFGRSVTSEVHEILNNDKKFDYDDKNHTFVKINNLINNDEKNIQQLQQSNNAPKSNDKVAEQNNDEQEETEEKNEEENKGENEENDTTSSAHVSSRSKQKSESKKSAITLD